MEERGAAPPVTKNEDRGFDLMVENAALVEETFKESGEGIVEGDERGECDFWGVPKVHGGAHRQEAEPHGKGHPLPDTDWSLG